MKKINNKSALLAIVLAVCFAVSLVPILAVSFYAHPVLDDLGYSAGVRHVILNGGGIAGALKAAADVAISTYYDWQGTFAAIFIFALQPGAFGDELYFLTTFIMLGALILSTTLFLDAVWIKWLGQRKSHMWILTMVVLFLQIQFAPDIAEGFFWFNGSSYYTLFYCFTLILATLLIRLLLTEDRKKEIWLTVAAALMAVIIGGGNYNTGLSDICMLALVTLILAGHKNRKYRHFLGILILLTSVFLFSMAAPGTAVRSAATQQMNPVRAIAMSLHHAMEDIGKWMTFEKIIALLLVAPLVYRAAAKCRWTFRYPLLVFIIAFGLYACQKTPVLYAMSYAGEGRQLNIFYYSYILMILFDIFYLSGWIQRKYAAMISEEKIWQAAREQMLPVLLVMAILFFAGCMNRDVRDLTSAQCAMWLANGYAQGYDEAFTANLAKLEMSEGPLYFDEIEKQPSVFKKPGLEEDGDFWVNIQFSNYYQCESVHLVPLEED